jgi:serine/threonine protein kinase
MREVSIMASLPAHKRVVQVYGFCMVGDELHIVMDLCEGGTLFKRLEQGSSLQFQLNVANDVAQGMAHLHRNGIAHRDLKSLNVLLDANDRAKVCDFGLSSTTSTATTKASTSAGSTAWMSPERLDEECEDDFKDDVYAYGIFLFELMTQSLPWDGHKVTQIVTKVCNKGLRPEHPRLANAEPSLVALMQRCLAQDSSERPTFRDIIENLSEVREQHVLRASAGAGAAAGGAEEGVFVPKTDKKQPRSNQKTKGKKKISTT